MLAALARLSCTSLSIMPAFWRMASATAFHLGSWSGVILSAALRSVMRCSTVWGLLEVAAAAAGGLPEPPVCAQAGPSEPATSAAPAREAIASERAMGVNNGKVMNGSFQRGRRQCACKETCALPAGFRSRDDGSWQIEVVVLAKCVRHLILAAATASWPAMTRAQQPSPPVIPGLPVTPDNRSSPGGPAVAPIPDT